MKNNQDFGVRDLLEEYRNKLLTFYAPHFEDEKSLTEFVELAFNYDDKYSQVRYMIQQVERFVSLANDIEKIRPARDPFRIFFLKTCLESLFTTAGFKEKEKPHFYTEFENCFSDEGLGYIFSCFEFTGIDKPDGLSIQQLAELSVLENQALTISSFLNIIKAIRDIFAHEGDFWSTQFFAQDTDSIWITSIRTKENIFDIEKVSWSRILDLFEQKKVTYFFHTKLDYSKFIFYFVQTCIKFIENKQENLLDKSSP